MGVGSISYIYVCLNILYLNDKTRRKKAQHRINHASGVTSLSDLIQMVDFSVIGCTQFQSH